MLMVSTPPSKDIVWQAGLKRKTQRFFVYKKIHLKNRNKHWLRVKG
jgi:transposase